jgi:hypothetical protein
MPAYDASLGTSLSAQYSVVFIIMLKNDKIYKCRLVTLDKLFLI